MSARAAYAATQFSFEFYPSNLHGSCFMLSSFLVCATCVLTTASRVFFRVYACAQRPGLPRASLRLARLLAARRSRVLFARTFLDAMSSKLSLIDDTVGVGRGPPSKQHRFKSSGRITPFADKRLPMVIYKCAGEACLHEQPWLDYCTDFGFCDSSVCEKDWRFRKRGTQAT